MARRGGFSGGMPGNMNNLMKQAQRMQRQMEEALYPANGKLQELSCLKKLLIQMISKCWRI